MRMFRVFIGVYLAIAAFLAALINVGAGLFAVGSTISRAFFRAYPKMSGRDEIQINREVGDQVIRGRQYLLMDIADMLESLWRWVDRAAEREEDRWLDSIDDECCCENMDIPAYYAWDHQPTCPHYAPRPSWMKTSDGGNTWRFGDGGK